MKNRKGFTLGETLCVVMILMILTAFAFVSVVSYQRKLLRTSDDNMAKEILVASQNRLSTLLLNDMIEIPLGSSEEEYYGLPNEKEEGSYFAIYNPNLEKNHGYIGTILRDILPQGVIEDTVRTKGSYIVKYNPYAGLIEDVFYSDAADDRFGYGFTGGKDLSQSNGQYTYGSALSACVESSTSKETSLSNRKNYGESKKVIGFYGGEKASDSYKTTEVVGKPSLKLVNDDVLYADISVTVPAGTTYDSNKDKVTLYLLEGANQTPLDSEIVLDPGRARDTTGNTWTWRMILDDTSGSGNRFKKMTDGRITPGADFSAQARVTVDTQTLKTDAKSCNSLFSNTTSISSEYGNRIGHAVISNFRHLMNLYCDGSENGSGINGAGLTFTDATQDANLDWNQYVNQVVKIRGLNESDKNSIAYRPLKINYPLTYDGMLYPIMNLKVDAQGEGVNAGIFGTISTNNKWGESLTFKNMELMSGNVKSARGNAGSLIGMSENPIILDNIFLSGSVYSSGYYSSGGLIGQAKRGVTVQNALFLSSMDENKHVIQADEGKQVNVVTAQKSAGLFVGMIGNYVNEVTEGNLTLTNNSYIRVKGNYKVHSTGRVEDVGYSNNAGGLCGYIYGSIVEGEKARIGLDFLGEDSEISSSSEHAGGMVGYLVRTMDLKGNNYISAVDKDPKKNENQNEDQTSLLISSGDGQDLTAGGLVGTLENYQDKGSVTIQDTAIFGEVHLQSPGNNGMTGGFIGRLGRGNMANATITNSFASIYCKSNEDSGRAGGFIGEVAAGNPWGKGITIKNCYAAGHNGDEVNVSGYFAGGFFGSDMSDLAQFMTVSDVYSTCSVEGTQTYEKYEPTPKAAGSHEASLYLYDRSITDNFLYQTVLEWTDYDGILGKAGEKYNHVGDFTLIQTSTNGLPNITRLTTDNAVYFLRNSRKFVLFSRIKLHDNDLPYYSSNGYMWNGYENTNRYYVYWIDNGLWYDPLTNQIQISVSNAKDGHDDFYVDSNGQVVYKGANESFERQYYSLAFIQ